MPFPSTEPIPDNWSAVHQPFASATLTGRIVLREPGEGGDWDPVLGVTEGEDGAVLYDGPFQAQSLARNSDSVQDAAGQAVTERDYLLVLRAEAPAAPPGTRCHVEECPDDAEMVGKVFSVTGPVLGSRRFERDLFVKLDMSNQAV